MYTQQKIKETILSLEQKYPVDTWVVNGIDVWPYVRIKLYIHLLVLMNKNTLKPKGNTSQAAKKVNKISKLLNKISLLFKAQLGLMSFFFKLKQKQIVFFGSHFHRVFQNGVYFNRFYDAMVEHHNLQDDVYTIEYQRIDKPLYNEKTIILLNKYLGYYKTTHKLFDKFKKKETDSKLKDYNAFYKELSNLNVKLDILKISETHLLKWAQKVNVSQTFFKKLYTHVKPSKVIFLGYYGYDDLYAALTVANQLRIKTIDFQHGPQTNVHLAFSSWNKVPEKGYNTMPTEFWHWDEASKESIDSWANKTKTVHAKVVGQPYLSYWMHNKTDTVEKNTIFYSLQTTPFSIETLLTPQIVTLIKSTAYHWVLRLHPRNNLDLNALQTFLKKNGIEDKATIQDAFTKPLPEALTQALLHITNFSGCLIEAFQLGVPTLLINEVGEEMFRQYIDHNLVYYLEPDSKTFQTKAQDLIEELKGKTFNNAYKEVFNPSL